MHMTVPQKRGPPRCNYYPKFHCELNHIEVFLVIVGDMQENTVIIFSTTCEEQSLTVQSVKDSTILAKYRSCLKMELYHRWVVHTWNYIVEWKQLTSH
jgi:hypothetical protein